jgi:hypothetical protein
MRLMWECASVEFNWGVSAITPDFLNEKRFNSIFLCAWVCVPVEFNWGVIAISPDFLNEK